MIKVYFSQDNFFFAFIAMCNQTSKCIFLRNSNVFDLIYLSLANIIKRNLYLTFRLKENRLVIVFIPRKPISHSSTRGGD